MISNFINPGQKVDLKAVRRVKTEDGTAKVYSTRIYDIVSEDTLELVMPMEQTKLILLPIDGEYQVFFYTDNGLYECTVRIIDRYKSNNVYILLVELESNLRKYQRRDYFRYSCAIDVESRELINEEIRAYEKNEAFSTPPGLPVAKGVIVDISGGGLRFVTKAQYDKEVLVFCNFKLNVHGRLKEFEAVCRVLDYREIPNRAGEYEHRVKFDSVDVDEREEIIQFIFEEERKNRRKERGLR